MCVKDQIFSDTSTFYFQRIFNAFSVLLCYSLSTMSVTVKVKQLDPRAVVPVFGHDDDAGFDIYSLDRVIIDPGKRTQIRTGIAMEIPSGYVGLIWDKSGLSHKHGLKTLGGVIDSGYRGEILVGIVNLSSDQYTIEQGHKVAQIIIQKKESIEIVITDVLSGTDRGENGFGSTGK